MTARAIPSGRPPRVWFVDIVRLCASLQMVNGHTLHAILLPSVTVGAHARLSRVVVDRGVQIPDGLVVGEDPVLDAQRFRRSAQGVCLVTQTMIDRLQD